MAHRENSEVGLVSSSPTTRERILDAAYDLFSRHGIRAVGVDAVVERSGVAKMTLYRHFRSKDALVLEVLERREERWTNGWLRSEVESRTEDPARRLLAIFDVFHEWFQRDDFEGCTFINVLLEMDDRESPLREASIVHLASIRTFLQELAEGVGAKDSDDFARRWHILMKGSIVAAGEGDREAAHRAQRTGALLLDEVRQPAASLAPAD